MHLLLRQMQSETIVDGIKVSDYPDDKLSVYGILKHDHNWDVLLVNESDKIKSVIKEEVQKLFGCKDGSSGFVEYYCKECDEYRTIHFGCNSRLCTSCGKKHTDHWAEELPKAMFDVPQRHIVLSISDKLWPVFLDRWDRMKVLMDAAIEVLKDVFSNWTRQRIEPGAVVVLHPFGRDMGFKPHIHIIVTEGGFDKKGNFVHMSFIPYKAMRKSWQYHLLTDLKAILPKTMEWSEFIDRLFKDHSDGFYAYLPPESRIRSLKELGKYLARYVRHPAIANFRLFGYDGKNVTFWYVDHDGKKHYKTMEVFEFIRALIQHVPDRQFKLIRHYGAYWRRMKARFRKYLHQSSIRQSKIEEFKPLGWKICPVCNSRMYFVAYRKKGPPERNWWEGRELKFGERLVDWPIVLRKST